jgi:outer membrane protein assembly factor BamB
MACGLLTVTGALLLTGVPASSTVSPVPIGWTMFGNGPLHSGVSPVVKIGAADAPDLTQAWSAQIGKGAANTLQASPIVAYNATLNEEIAYQTGINGTVEALVVSPGRPTSVLWSTSAPGGVYSTPALYGNTLYFGSQKGVLFALDATTGAVQCTFNLPAVAPELVPGRIMASPVVGVVDGTGPIVFFGDTGDYESLNGGHEWAVTAVGNTAGGCQQRWSFNQFANLGKNGDDTGTWAQPSLVNAENGQWLVVFGSTNPDDSIYAVNAVTGAEVWRYQTVVNGGDDDVGAGPTISPPGVNGFRDGVVYDCGKDMYEVALDLRTGKLLWSYNFDADSGPVPVATSVADLVGDTLYEAYNGYVYSMNATTGTVNWRTATQVGMVLDSPVISGAPGDQVLFIGDLSGNVWAYRISDGTLVWSKALGDKVIASAAVADGLLVMASGTTLYGFTPSTPKGGRATPSRHVSHAR